MGNMKRVAVWLILISYPLMACGNMLEAGCCRNEPAHAPGEHTAHAHAHSKVQRLIHGLSHWSVPEDTQFVVSRHCCCVKQGEQDPGLYYHFLTPQFRTPKPSDFPSTAIAPEGLGLLAGNPSAGSPHLFANLDPAFILRSIHSTILLI
jgi:hypothetical protein